MMFITRRDFRARLRAAELQRKAEAYRKWIQSKHTIEEAVIEARRLGLEVWFTLEKGDNI